MASTDFTLPSGSLVLVTGVNGFVASHIVDQLLQRGFRVRGTVRDTTKSSWVKELFDKRHGSGKFELTAGEFTKESSFSDILKDVTAVIHTVGVTNFSPDPNQVVTPTIAIAINLLKASLAVPTIKRFVYTSSSVAIAFSNPNTVFPVNSTVYNDSALQAAWAPPPYTPDRAFAAYTASKLESEYAIRKFEKEHKPHFAINFVNPNTVLGEILAPKNQDGSTAGLTIGLYTGEKSFWNTLPPQYFIEAKDVALLHIAAAILPGVEGERLLGYAAPFSQTEIVEILRKNEPGKKFGDGPEGEGRDISEVDSKRSLELVSKLKGGKGWTSLEETVKENVKHLQ